MVKRLVLAAVLCLVTVGFSMSEQNPWELTKWKNDKKQTQFQYLLMSDWNEIGAEGKFWIVRGYVLATLMWYGKLQQDGYQKTVDYMTEIWPVNESQLAYMMSIYCMQPYWKDQYWARAFIEVFIDSKRAGLAPLNR